MNETSCAHICTSIWCSQMNFGLWSFNRCVVVSHCCFNFHFPENIHKENMSFTCQEFAICISSLLRVSDKIFGPFNWAAFLLFSFKSSLSILDNNPLSDVSFANVAPCFVACLFILLTVSFREQLIAFKSPAYQFSLYHMSFALTLYLKVIAKSKFLQAFCVIF